MRDLDEKNEYRHKQAAACRTAATVSTVAEVRQAFLDLEQGWLQLIGAAPETSPTSHADADVKTDKLKSKRRRCKSHSAMISSSNK